MFNLGLWEDPHPGYTAEGDVDSEGHHDEQYDGHGGGPGRHGHVDWERTETEPGREGDSQGRGSRFYPGEIRCRVQAEVGEETALVPVSVTPVSVTPEIFIVKMLCLPLILYCTFTNVPRPQDNC